MSIHILCSLVYAALCFKKNTVETYPRRQAAALAGFCVILSRKNHDSLTAVNLCFNGVCNVKNCLTGGFLMFYARSAANP
jgi:hypothetical protein